jgi:hypothetical protein
MDAARLVCEGDIPMTRNLISGGLVVGALVAGSAGCETLHSSVRHKDYDEVARKDDDDSPKVDGVSSDVSKLRSVDPDEKSNQPFFKSTRARSAFSSFSPEAQEIEKNLGVY